MKQSKVKRALVKFLAVMMVFMMLPVNALAAESVGADPVETVPVEAEINQEEGSSEEALIDLVNEIVENAAAAETAPGSTGSEEDAEEPGSQESDAEIADGSGLSEEVTDASETDMTPVSESEVPSEIIAEEAEDPVDEPDADPEAESIQEAAPESEPVPEVIPEPEPVEEPIPEAAPEEPETAEEPEPVQVTVNITGKTSTAEYTGEEIAVEGYDAEVSDPELVSVELAEGREAAARGTEPGVYRMNLTEEDFSITAAESVKVILTIKDGQLEIKGNPETVSIKVKVNWDDEDDWSEIRPESVEVKLLADGEDAGVEALVLSEENEWSGKWTDLPKYAEEKEISYNVEEKLTDVITGEDAEESYSFKVEGNAEEGFTVVNVHTPVIYEYETGGVSGRVNISDLTPGYTSTVRYPGLRAAGQEPAHSKTASDNGDGTYKLELSVTGDADTEVETAANVNVLIVYDESSSMTSNNVTTNPNRNRADYAEDIMHDFIESLRGYQNSTDPSNIQVALVGFGPRANGRQSWTSDLTGGNNGVNRFFDDGVDGTVTSSHNYNSNNGTNWEAALQQAQTYLNALDTAQDTDPTFVILVTDGACTASGNGNNAINPAGNRPWTDFQPFYNEARNEARAIENRANTELLGIYAYGREADLLDDLIYYAQNGSDRPGMNGNTVATDNYFSATDTAALTQAIESIFQKIVEALGISNAIISDGTTNQVRTSTSEISELLEVDEDSYQYWLSIPVVNNQFTRIDLVSGDPVTYTVTDNGDGTSTVTWGSNSVTVNGSVKGGQLKYEWTGANALYDKTPPAAHLVNGAVDWDLSSVGTLLDGVTYSLTFDVYPSQTTLDYVADIKNDPGADGAWADFDPEIQKYINEEGDLKTNTTATLTYVDTRTGTSGSTTYTNPDPVENQAVKQLAITKKWENEIDQRVHPPVTLGVTRDGEETYEVTLNEGNQWSDSVYVSIGIMKDGQPLSGSEGHDFTFTEPKGLTYHWELNAPVVHPMLIDGDGPFMLIKVDEKHPIPDGATTYSFNGATYYVDNEAASLEAINERRSRLYLTKTVEGEDAPDDAIFPFTINVVNSLAPATEPQDDSGHDSDYWVWISVWDENGDPVTEGVEGAASGGGGWWYAPSGTDVTIPVGAGYSVMVNNLPSGTTYTITEGELPTGVS